MQTGGQQGAAIRQGFKLATCCACCSVHDSYKTDAGEAGSISMAAHPCIFNSRAAIADHVSILERLK
jgi:hypothetical protein